MTLSHNPTYMHNKDTIFWPFLIGWTSGPKLNNFLVKYILIFKALDGIANRHTKLPQNFL